jgi:U3 small nucleolar RNA-associated protein 4
MDVHFGTKVRKIVGSDESQGEWIALDKERPRVPGEDDEAYEYDETFAATNETTLARLRRTLVPKWTSICD